MSSSSNDRSNERWFLGEEQTDYQEWGWDGRIWCPPSAQDEADALASKGTPHEHVAEPYEVARLDDEENARRILACVEACRGLATEDLRPGELARLREALTRIAAYDQGEQEVDSSFEEPRAAMIAREALGGKKQEQQQHGEVVVAAKAKKAARVFRFGDLVAIAGVGHIVWRDTAQDGTDGTTICDLRFGAAQAEEGDARPSQCGICFRGVKAKKGSPP